MFLNAINKEFADCLCDGKIVCEQGEFKTRLQNILNDSSSNRNNTVSKRKPSNFVLFRKDKSNEIKTEYFADYDNWTDWSENGIQQYYKEKKLSTEKLEKFIEKQKEKGKDIFKPKLAALISIQAGVMWKQLSDEQKQAFSRKDDTQVINQSVENEHKDKQTSHLEASNNDVQHVEVNFEKKKGRPKGTQPVNSVSNTAILETFEQNDDIELEEFEFEGATYFRDNNAVVYSMDNDENFTEIGNYVNEKVEFN